MSEEKLEGKDVPYEDVTVYYRPTEKSVGEDVVMYYHAVLRDEGTDFIKILDAKTRLPVAIFARGCVVRVDFTPHEEKAPPAPVAKKGIPTQG